MSEDYPKPGRDYIGVGVGFVIFNEDGKALLCKRGQNTRNEQGKWEFPGGGLKFGETLKDAAIREAKEELGIEVDIVDLLDWNDHILPEEQQHWVALTFICRIVNGTPKNREPHKCDTIGWFDLKEVENLPLSKISQMNLGSLRKRFSQISSRPSTLF